MGLSSELSLPPEPIPQLGLRSSIILPLEDRNFVRGFLTQGFIFPKASQE
jgi:hypothetical protein